MGTSKAPLSFGAETLLDSPSSDTEQSTSGAVETPTVPAQPHSSLSLVLAELEFPET